MLSNARDNTRIPFSKEVRCSKTEQVIYDLRYLRYASYELQLSHEARD